jgi:hypothetical protein
MSLEPGRKGPSPSPPPPAFAFTLNPSVTAFNIPVKAFLSQHHEYDAIAAGTLVYDSQDRLLLIQRAAHDSMPSRWGMLLHELLVPLLSKFREPSQLSTPETTPAPTPDCSLVGKC